MTVFLSAAPPRALPGLSPSVYFPRALGSQIAATELPAPSPFASAEWGLKHAVPPVEGPAELSLARSPGCPFHPRDTGLATQCWWPRPPPIVLALLKPWVSLGRAAQSWALLPVELKTGAPECRRQLTEDHFTFPRAPGCQFSLFHRSMLHPASQIGPPSFPAILPSMALVS